MGGYTDAVPGKKYQYAHKGTLLKQGKSKPGTLAGNFSLKNASVIREFYLTKSISKRYGRGPRYCDIVIMDLDLKDGLFITIENKLFTTNHPHQLQEYYDTVEAKFSNAKVREYIYLTLYGSNPVEFTEQKTSKYRYWLRVSWTNHILEIIKKLSNGNEPKEVKLLVELLNWLKCLRGLPIHKELEAFRELIINVTAECLLEELWRLGEGKTGHWDRSDRSGKNVILKHSSYPASQLYIELLPNFSITAQGRKSGQASFEKIIVPFGANSDQIYNLLDIAAKDIYHYFFSGKINLYKADKRRLALNQTGIRKNYKPLFDFLSKYHYYLKVLLMSLDMTWMAQVYEIKADYGIMEGDQSS